VVTVSHQLVRWCFLFVSIRASLAIQFNLIHIVCFFVLLHKMRFVFLQGTVVVVRIQLFKTELIAHNPRVLRTRFLDNIALPWVLRSGRIDVVFVKFVEEVVHHVDGIVGLVSNLNFLYNRVGLVKFELVYNVSSSRLAFKAGTLPVVRRLYWVILGVWI